MLDGGLGYIVALQLNLCTNLDKHEYIYIPNNYRDNCVGIFVFFHTSGYQTNKHLLYNWLKALGYSVTSKTLRQDE